ncbi:glycosyltransferase family 2 protein [Tenacibaculum sp. SG-28]|uniref:glycosyltransferase family 2 protein n=1 Tax=Tenacibaculum sp. SG-28 TaxID=754426 RepID=UPI000CF3D366|nr:glycosyltransferase family 2 protein [Tenacibaculum sp. SG-28]PQJ21874.1 hypothetical protein BSU00_07475 [Tenacibaculum sp. SG-28]
MKESKVYIIILNYNSYEDTIECLESVMKLKYSSYEIILVDNASTNNALHYIREWAAGTSGNTISSKHQELVYPLVAKPIPYNLLEEKEIEPSEHPFTIIKAAKNRGFAAGNNIGIRYAISKKDSRYFWLLNNDTVVDKDSLFYMVKYHESKNIIGILGCKLLYYDYPNTLQAVGGIFNPLLYTSKHLGEGMGANITKSDFRKIDYVIGASMFVPLGFIKEVGLLNEDYFLYYEELDWVFRAKNTKWEIDWCADAVVYHKEGKTIGSSSNFKKRSDFSEIEVFRSRKIFYTNFPKNTFSFWVSSYLIIGNRIRRRQCKLASTFFRILHK